MGICGKIFFLFKFIAASVVCAVTWLTILILSLPVFTLRFIVQVLAKIFRPDLSGILKPKHAVIALDRIFARHGFSTNINIVCFIDNDLDIKTVTKVLDENLFPPKSDYTEYEYEGLRKSLTSFCGYWFWKKIENFDIRDYVYSYEDSIRASDCSSVAPPIRKEYNEDDLKEIASYLPSKPWRKNHALWEMIILRNYKPSSAITAKKQTVLIICCHHCLGDGYSLQKLLKVITNHDGKAEAVPNYKKQNNIVYKVLLPLIFPFKAFFDLTIYLADRLWDTNDWINRPKDPKRTSLLVTWTDPIPVERIKNLKRKFGVSFVAVITEICGAAFRKMMIETGVKPPKHISCLIPFPLPKHRGGLRIHTASAVLKLHTGEMDALERLYRSHRTLEAEKGSTGPFVLLQVLNYMGYLPLAIPVLKRLQMDKGLTAGLTTFPGLATAIHFPPGHEIRHSFFFMGLPQNLSAVGAISTLTHCGNIIFSLTCVDYICKSRKQLEEFMHFVYEEIQLLEEANATEIMV